MKDRRKDGVHRSEWRSVNSPKEVPPDTTKCKTRCEG